MLRLFHQHELVALIRRPSAPGLSWRMGTVELSPTAKKYEELFSFFSDEEKFARGKPPFPSELINNWTVEVENGKRRPITVPLLTEDGEIFWIYQDRS